MRQPTFHAPGVPAREIGRLWETPVIVIGRSWLPVVQLVLWPLLSWRAGRLAARRSLAERLGIGALETCTVLGAEWCHNLAHLVAAHLVRRPMDALRIVFGMPLCIYYEVDPQDVTPRQHILRALGGPLFNACAAASAWIWRRVSKPGSASHQIAGTTAATSLFILGAGLLPYPALDGGPVLKWSLVERGCSMETAERAVRVADGVVGAGLLTGAAAARRRGRRGLAALLALLGLLGLSYAVGALREE